MAVLQVNAQRNSLSIGGILPRADAVPQQCALP